jgi:ABC-2 type transport system permease protein
VAALGGWAFGFRVLEPGLGPVAVFLFGCFVNAWIVGVFVCALITLFGNRAEAFAWASVNLVLMLAGIYYPVSVLPEPAAAIARAIPLTYFLDAYRAHFGFAAEFASPITTGLTLSAVYAVAAHWAFLTAIQRARRTGLLLKMSE